MSVVDSRTLVGNVELSDEGVTMNGSVVRRVCCVVGTVVITVDIVGGRLHWSDIVTTVKTRPPTRAIPTTPAVDTAAVERYQGSGWRPGSCFDCAATGADPSDPATGGNSAAGVG